MFYVGQKVVCVDAACAFSDWTREWLIKGQTYTIAGLAPSPKGRNYPGSLYTVRLTEAPDKPNGFAEARFRPIQERKTDIGFAHEILRKATKRKPATV